MTAIMIKDATGMLIPAPHFDGWVAIGLDQPKRKGDVFVRFYHGEPSWVHPDTSSDTMSYDHDQTPRQCGDDEAWCVYRKAEYIEIIDPDELARNGDVGMNGAGYPTPEAQVAKGYTICYPPGTKMPHIKAFHHHGIRIWRLVTQPGRPQSPGNLHFRQPLPLP